MTFVEKCIEKSVTHQHPSNLGRYYSLKYVNAKDVLPPEILAQVQKYTCGALIYVPKTDDEKIGWGQLSGARAQVFQRNSNITEAYRSGAAINELMREYCLSEASIRKIIYSKEFAPSA
ncbi:MAG: CD3324 family protein [Defluviitaleaceae bacterium]|nr:CD3324 family protein [Defluviitaleaceae bacterium]